MLFASMVYTYVGHYVDHRHEPCVDCLYGLALNHSCDSTTHVPWNVQMNMLYCDNYSATGWLKYD